MHDEDGHRRSARRSSVDGLTCVCVGENITPHVCRRGRASGPVHPSSARSPTAKPQGGNGGSSGEREGPPLRSGPPLRLQVVPPLSPTAVQGRDEARGSERSAALQADQRSWPGAPRQSHRDSAAGGLENRRLPRGVVCRPGAPATLVVGGARAVATTRTGRQTSASLPSRRRGASRSPARHLLSRTSRPKATGGAECGRSIERTVLRLLPRHQPGSARRRRRRSPEERLR